MKNTIFIFSFLSIIILSLIACEDKNENNPAPNLGYSYVPLFVGSSIEYKVDSIVYDDFTLPVSVDTFHYEVKEKIEELFLDGENRESYKVGRYLKMDSTQSWKLDRLFTMTKTKIRFEKNDENIPTVNLVFPVSQNKVWNGNALNSLPEQEFSYENVHHSMSINKHYFDSTVKVIQLNEENLIEKKYKEEIYATDIGLIYKKSEMLETELNGNIRSGTIVTYSFNNPLGLFPQ